MVASSKKTQIEQNPHLAEADYKPAKAAKPVFANWEDSYATQSLKNESCHVWAVNLDQSLECQNHLRHYLSTFEHEKGNRYYDPQDGARYLVGRSILRILIGQYIGQHPAEIDFGHAENGKPNLKNSSLRFSKTSSAGLGLVAFLWKKELGVDIEEIKKSPGIMSLSKTFFSEKEINDLRKVSPLEYKHFFYRAWTRKEAVLKALGIGLSFPPDQLTVSLGSAPEFNLAIEGIASNYAQDWQLNSFLPTARHQAALAILGSHSKTSYYRLIA